MTDRFWSLVLQSQIARLTRSGTEFGGLSEACDAFVFAAHLLVGLPGDRAAQALLVDLRAVPQRGDQAFEDATRDLRARLFAGFHVGAVLVRTLSGKLQLDRIERGDQTYRGFDDEDEALAYLTERLAER